MRTGKAIAFAPIQPALYIMLCEAACPDEDGPLRIAVVCVPDVCHVGEHSKPAKDMCRIPSVVHRDHEAHVQKTARRENVVAMFTVPTRWSFEAFGEVAQSRIQLKSAVAAELQPMSPERVQVKVPEGIMALQRLVKRHDARSPT